MEWISSREFWEEEDGGLQNRATTGKSGTAIKGKSAVKAAENFFQNLPENIIYDILLKIPAEELHRKFRFVCKSWYNMISSRKFMAQNAVNNKTELVIQTSMSISRSMTTRLLLEKEEEEIGFKLCKFEMKRVGRMRPGCNGIHLLNGSRGWGARVMHVLNPLTMDTITLPQCPSSCPHTACGSALGYDSSAKEYKLVHVYSDGFGFEIFTLGSADNRWRVIPGPFQPFDRPFGWNFSWSDPVSLNGQVLHWYVSSSEYLVSMEVSSQEFRRTPLPNSSEKINENSYALIEMDEYLSLVHTVSHEEIDIWILKDFQARVWIKKHSIIAGSIKYPPPRGSSLPNEYKNNLPDIRKLVAVASLRNGEVLVFKLNISRTGFGFYLYDITTMVLRKFNMKTKAQQYFIPHRSSLLCLTPKD